MPDQAINVASYVVLFGVPLVMLFRYRLSIAGLARRVWPRSAGEAKPEAVTIEQAYAALQVVEAWGQDKVQPFHNGTKLIRDHWLQTADDHQHSGDRHEAG